MHNLAELHKKTDRDITPSVSINPEYPSFRIKYAYFTNSRPYYVQIAKDW